MMTAEFGLIDAEYHSPEFAQSGGAYEMIQLWVNLPARDKMSDPHDQFITSDQFPALALPGEAGTVRLIAGSHDDSTGPAPTFTPMNVCDLRLKAGHRVTFDLPAGHTTVE